MRNDRNGIDWRKLITLLAELSAIGAFVTDVITLVLSYF
jgi:hypothetical protein